MSLPITIQAVLARVRSDDSHTRNAIRAVLDLQTNAELMLGDSIHDNGAGFRARYQDRDDAGLARQLVLTRDWSPEDRRRALGLCWTYRRQLVAIANGCRTRWQVGNFRLRAIHDEESRSYRRAAAQAANTIRQARTAPPSEAPTDLAARVDELASRINALAERLAA